MRSRHSVRTMVTTALVAAALGLSAQNITLPNQKDSLKFAVIGDSGTGSASQYRVAEKLTASRASFPYEFVLMMGDNLGDFTDKAGGTIEERMAAYKDNMDRWGKQWIMLPNPEYGSWESASFNNEWKKPADERRQMKIDRLEAWTPSN